MIKLFFANTIQSANKRKNCFKKDEAEKYMKICLKTKNSINKI